MEKERFFKLLEIPNTASQEEIKQAYYTKLKAVQSNNLQGISLEEINEACEKLMARFSGNKSNINQTRCIKEDIFIESVGLLKYSLSNDFNEILEAIFISSGKDSIYIDGKRNSFDDIKWTLNTGLSENVKKAMNKYDVEYSMTTYKEGQTLVVVINRHIGDKWYIVSFDDELERSCLEEEVVLEETGKSLRYSLSNDINDIKRAIDKRTGYNVNLDAIIPKLNSNLSISVKQLMNKHNVNFSMTTCIQGDYRRIWINERKGNGWYTAIIQEKDDSLYIIDW